MRLSLQSLSQMEVARGIRESSLAEIDREQVSSTIH